MHWAASDRLSLEILTHTALPSRVVLHVLMAALLACGLGCQRELPTDTGDDAATVTPHGPTAEQARRAPGHLAPEQREAVTFEAETELEPWPDPELADPLSEPLPVLQVAPLEVEKVDPPAEPMIELRIGVASAPRPPPPNRGDPALERLLFDIRYSIQHRPTLVVWIIDQSCSMELRRRRELPLILKALETTRAFQLGANATPEEAPPLLNAVIAYGEQVTLLTDTPTANVEDIRQAFERIAADTSGVENTFQALDVAISQFKEYSHVHAEAEENSRSVCFVLITDEVGSDANNPEHGFEPCIERCREQEIFVNVLGSFVPLGRAENDFQWIDLDFEQQHPGQQSPQRGVVNSGLETRELERIQVSFPHQESDPIDSGFGPFALTRLCYETGGIYLRPYAPHPTEHDTTHAEDNRFGITLDPTTFDQAYLLRYRPEYSPLYQYENGMNHHFCRQALVEAATLTSKLPPWEAPFAFPQESEAEFQAATTTALAQAANYKQQLELAHELLAQQQESRAEEQEPRWQVGYDLAMGQLLVMRVRLENYHALISQAQQGELPALSAGKVWSLEPVAHLPEGSELQPMATEAHDYLQRVIEEHPDTPWALLAERELTYPLNWYWLETEPPNSKPAAQPAPMHEPALPVPRTVPAL